MSHPMIPAEPEGNQTKHTKQKRCSLGKEKGSLTHDKNDRSLHTFCGMNQSHTLSTVQSVLGARASCLSSFHLELQTVVVVWNSDVELAIEAAEAPKRRVDGVESVGGSDDDRLPTTFMPSVSVRSGRPCASFHAWSNGVYLINEDDGGSVFLGLLEGLT